MRARLAVIQTKPVKVICFWFKIIRAEMPDVSGLQGLNSYGATLKFMGFGDNGLGSFVLQSPVDGKPMLLTPEESITIQVSLSIFYLLKFTLLMSIKYFAEQNWSRHNYGFG